MFVDNDKSPIPVYERLLNGTINEYVRISWSWTSIAGKIIKKPPVMVAFNLFSLVAW